MESAEGVGPEASKKGMGASANLSAPDNLGEPAFVEARSDSGSQSSGVTKSSEMMKSQMEESRTDEGNEEVRKAWPPKKEELEQLYLTQRLSAMKISRIYGLKYPNPKSGETMVFWYLKKYGIQRRDRAEHIRKVTEGMVDEWVKRYERGESLKQIAEAVVGPVTVFTHLKGRGVQLRDKVEAQIKAVTKYQRKPFSGNDEERAYLAGFRTGDLDVVKHGRAVRVRTGTTHPAMVELFQELFGRYGYVHSYPRRAPWTGHEWNLEADLGGSFEFLLLELSKVPREFAAKPHLFYRFLAGFFDAEGSIYPHRKKWGTSFEIQIPNVNFQLLTSIFRCLQRMNYNPKLEFQNQEPERLGYRQSGTIWRIRLWRHSEVARLLMELPLRHRERTAKKELALRFFESNDEETIRKLLSDWDRLREEIRSERVAFVEKARVARIEMKILTRGDRDNLRFYC